MRVIAALSYLWLTWVRGLTLGTEKILPNPTAQSVVIWLMKSSFPVVHNLRRYLDTQVPGITITTAKACDCIMCYKKRSSYISGRKKSVWARYNPNQLSDKHTLKYSWINWSMLPKCQGQTAKEFKEVFQVSGELKTLQQKAIQASWLDPKERIKIDINDINGTTGEMKHGIRIR